VQLIDAARRALAQGNFRGALAELDTYDRSAKPGALVREARVLRIEALQRAGETARARALAEQYLLEFPQDAHATRLRSLTSLMEAR
jgi:outer membrane protein assembly factor BamD (BamD/ComL family)